VYEPQKDDPTLLANYRPIALMNNLLKLWTALVKDACPKYGETQAILSEQHDGFRLLRNTLDSMMMEDAKLYSKDMYIMYADFKRALNAVDHRVMFKHMR
jgi:hypothetical protein